MIKCGTTNNKDRDANAKQSLIDAGLAMDCEAPEAEMLKRNDKPSKGRRKVRR